MPHLVVVPHTHWDREWYRTHEQFRARLVGLLDGLLELLERDPGFRCFSLDGQTIVLDDYLAVRPHARTSRSIRSRARGGSRSARGRCCPTSGWSRARR